MLPLYRLLVQQTMAEGDNSHEITERLFADRDHYSLLWLGEGGVVTLMKSQRGYLRTETTTV